MNDLSLAADFPAATREQWLKLVEGVLKGADFDRKLVSRTYDGLRLEPLYPKAGSPPSAARQACPWRVSQRLDHPDPSAANGLALADLEGGADALTLVLSGVPAARGFGVEAGTLDALDRALQGVMLDLVPLRLDAGAGGERAAALLMEVAERRGHALAGLDLDLGLDPVGAFAATGRLSAPWDTVAARLADTSAALSQRGFRGRAFLADGRPYHEAGAGEAQELAAVLATGLAYLRTLETGGHDLDAARNALAFLLVADADEFLTIAKFRALRRLWARVEAACSLEPRPIRLHAETAWRMTTRRDPWVNLLRAAMAVFSAGIGGADTITVLPFTAALGLPDAFARRMARNTQLILLEESNLWRVADPAAGAGAFEAVTDALCQKAWALFQDIEREGGMVESLRAGALQGRIAEVRAERDRNIARRRDPITGTSEFPNLHEGPVGVLAPSPRPEASAGPLSGQAVVPEAPPLPSTRAAEPFERLRDASDERLAETGVRPLVFLANLGPIAAFTARATFARNFFEAGGIEAVSNDGFSAHSALAEAFAASGARIACLCSSDEIYATHALAAAQALSGAGARRIYLAGRPGDLPDDLVEPLRQAGVSDHIHTGCDVLRTLVEAQASA